MTRDKDISVWIGGCVYLLANGNGYYQATLNSLNHLHM